MLKSIIMKLFAILIILVYIVNLFTITIYAIDLENNEEVSGDNVIETDNKNEIEENETEEEQQLKLPKMSISLEGLTLKQLNSGSKDKKYSGNTLTLESPENIKYNLTDSDVEIKGRGNSSWLFPKKSYQIKLSSKENVLGMGKAKTWLLIANYGDNTLMRNKLMYDLAQELGLEYTQNCKWIDLWIDEEYQGVYLLTEKVQVGTNRVELKDNSGVIVEMDNNYYASETSYFKSNESGSYFVLKDSVADDEDMENSQSKKALKDFQNYINRFEKLLYAENKNWAQISSMIDVESFIKYYFIQEFSENADGARTSVFMYKDGNSDILHMGPVWDFDLALANCDKAYWGGNPEYDYIMNIKKYMESSVDWYTQLFTIPEFRDEVSRIYNDEIKEVLETATQKIDNYKQELQDVVAVNFQKWNTLGKTNPFGSYRGHKIKNTYNEEVGYLSEWVEKRVNYLNERYATDSNICKVKYTSHIQDYGWNNSIFSIDGDTSGTTGESKRIEAIKISLDSFNSQISKNANIKYQVHVQDIGWMDWKQNGEIAGTSGRGLRIEALRIKLENIKEYAIEYRVHVQNIGWTDWMTDGELAGTEGRSLRIEAIQIRLTEPKNNIVSYTTHVQNIGWQQNVTNGKMSGTTGQSLRLEGIKIKLLNKTDDIHIKYCTHIENIGWQDWKYDNDLSGTTGQSLRLEAIKISLEGKDAEKYNVYYRVHVQNIGWTEWKKNGEMSGTSGQSLRLEGIEIKIEEIR